MDQNLGTAVVVDSSCLPDEQSKENQKKEKSKEIEKKNGFEGQGNSPICSDLLRFRPICSNLFSEQIRTNQGNPFCRPLP